MELINNFLDIFNQNIIAIIPAIVRIAIACFLGGIIGVEREQHSQAAGFRTHMLVCVGATLVMITSEFIYNRFSGVGSIDPARLGAQVISGIGFLGAGTIIKHGASVKGLTTAASLWAVACIGLACGIGFFGGAIVATLFIYLTLAIFKKWENKVLKPISKTGYVLTIEKKIGIITRINAIIEECRIDIRNIAIENGKNNTTEIVRLLLKSDAEKAYMSFVEKLKMEDGILKIEKE